MFEIGYVFIVVSFLFFSLKSFISSPEITRWHCLCFWHYLCNVKSIWTNLKEEKTYLHPSNYSCWPWDRNIVVYNSNSINSFSLVSNLNISMSVNHPSISYSYLCVCVYCMCMFVCPCNSACKSPYEQVLGRFLKLWNKILTRKIDCKGAPLANVLHNSLINQLWKFKLNPLLSESHQIKF